MKLVCVDINPAVVTKLSDRGSLESVGVVTDVGLFLSLLVRQLDRLNQAWQEAEVSTPRRPDGQAPVEKRLQESRSGA